MPDEGEPARRPPLFLPLVLRPNSPTVDLEPRLPYLPLEAIDVQAYDIHLVAADPGRKDLRLSVQLTVLLRHAADHVDLQVEPGAIRISRVAVGSREGGFSLLPGQANAYGLTGTRLRVGLGRTVPAGGAVKIQLDYTIAPASLTDDRGFTYQANFHGSRILTTRSWPYYARFWLPSHDHPHDPATVSFELHVPDGFIAAANGRLVEGDYTTGSGLDAEGLRIFRWTEEVPIATYNIHLTVGQLAILAEELCFNTDTVNRDRVPCEQAQHRLPVVYYYPPGLKNRQEYVAQIRKAGQAVIYYSSLWDPYRFEKLAWVTEPHPFNQEHVGLITLISPGAAVHEAVHSWWGNTVTIQHWGDLWISEGFATYFSGFYDEVSSGSLTSCLSTEGRLNHPPDTDPLDIFDLTPYCKGAAALHDLRQRIAAAAGLPMQNATAQALFLDTIGTLYDTYATRQLSTTELIDFLHRELPLSYLRHGFAVQEEVVSTLVEEWAAEWFHLGAENPSTDPEPESPGRQPSAIYHWPSAKGSPFSAGPQGPGRTPVAARQPHFRQRP